MQIKLGTDFKANVEQGLEPEQKKKQEKGKEDFETRFSHCSKVSVDPIYPPKVSSIGNKGHLAKAVTMSKCNVWFILSVILWNLSILCHSRRELQADRLHQVYNLLSGMWRKPCFNISLQKLQRKLNFFKYQFCPIFSSQKNKKIKGIVVNLNEYSPEIWKWMIHKSENVT